MRALRAIMVCGIAELALNLFNQNFPLPRPAVAFDDFSSTNICMGFGGIIAYTDGHTRVERANRYGTGSFERITHS
jgi:hypothetical protein